MDAALQARLEAARREPGEVGRWIDLAQAAIRAGSLDALPLDPECLVAIAGIQAEHPGESALAHLVLAGFGLRAEAARHGDPAPGIWATLPRSELVEGTWTDRRTGLPIAVRRLRDRATMLLSGRAGRRGFVYLDRDPVTVAGLRTWLEVSRRPEPPPWLLHPPPLEGPATCVTREEAEAYAAWVGGHLPSEPVLAMGCRVLGLDPEASGFALVRDGGKEIGEDLPCRWTLGRPVWRREEPATRIPSDWRPELEAVESAPAIRLGLPGDLAGRIARIHEWTTTQAEWARFTRTGDNWLDAPDVAAFEEKEGTRSAPRATVLTGRCQGPRRGIRPVGASPGDRDPLLGFRVAVSPVLPAGSELVGPWLEPDGEAPRGP